ncbi:MAG: hypothetical protein JXR70_19795 [Spirochaetales bacterium]|nr:hypothetical protein [Spirochaetales bacterium]
MISISRSEFNKDFQRFVLEVEERGEDLIITEEDLPLFIIQPANRGPEIEDIFGDVQGHVVYAECLAR